MTTSLDKTSDVPLAPSRDSAVDRRVVVPYVTSWSEEEDPPYELVERRGFGLAYADETLADRDRRGVLWQRAGFGPGRGRPEFGKVHPLRQRRAMLRLLCQVCGGPADRTEDGVLWLFLDDRDDWPGWPENVAETEPPVCLACVRTSVRLCPALRRGAVAVRARRFPVAGVYGAVYRAGSSGPVAMRDGRIAFDDPAIRWVHATRLIRELHECAIVPLAQL